MTVKQTLLFDAYNALLALATAALPTFTIYDGPQVQIPVDQNLLMIGCEDPLSTGTTVAVSNGAQEWASLGAGKRTETFSIACAMTVWVGETDLSLCRTNAAAAIDALGAALRPPPAGTGDAQLNNVLNQGGSGTGWCGMALQRIDQAQTQDGAALHVLFTVDCTARV